MEILFCIGVCMIILCGLCGSCIYLAALGYLHRMHLPTVAWLFFFSTVAGGVCYFFAEESLEGVEYISYIYMLLGGIAAFTLFRTVFGGECEWPAILWIYFLLLFPLGILGVLFAKNVFH